MPMRLAEAGFNNRRSWAWGVVLAVNLLAPGHVVAGPGAGAAVAPAPLRMAGPAGDPSRLARRVTQQISMEQVRRAISGYLQGRMDGRVSEVEVEVLEPSDPVVVPAGRLQLEVAASSGIEQSGRRRFQVIPSVDGRPGDRIEVVTDVSLYADVVVAARMLKPEEVIEAEDLSTARVKVSGLPHQLVTGFPEAVGKSPGRVLPPNQPIRLASLVRPLTVRKGDRVTIEARRGGLAIQAVGTTKTAGQLGTFVTVTNADSGKDIRAKVVGPGLVRVEF